MALIISRRPRESVTALLPNGERIVITMGDKHGSGRMLLFDAPKHIKILRTEAIDDGKASDSGEAGSVPIPQRILGVDF